MDPMATNKSAISVSPARGCILVCCFLQLCRSIRCSRSCWPGFVWKPIGSLEKAPSVATMKGQKVVVFLNLRSMSSCWKFWNLKIDLKKKHLKSAKKTRYGQVWLDVFRVSAHFSPHPKTTVLNHYPASKKGQPTSIDGL